MSSSFAGEMTALHRLVRFFCLKGEELSSFLELNMAIVLCFGVALLSLRLGDLMVL